MRKWIIAAVGGLLLSGAAAAQQVLTVATWAGPNHGFNTMVVPTWKKWIEEATDNRVTLRLVHDMAPPASQMDLIADGVADIGWFYPGYTPGRFELTKVAELPTFQEFSSEVAAAAYWRTHEKFLAKGNEHRGAKLIGVGVHGPGQIFTREKVDGLDGLKNLRVRSGGGVMSEVAAKLGVVGVALPPTAVYEAGSTGVIDGATLTYEGLRSFRVAEVMPYTLTLPGGFYRGAFSILINETSWNRLSEADRRAIEGVSGERLSRLFGYMMDTADQRGIEFAKEKGNTFTSLSEADVARLKERTADLPASWIKAASRRIDDPKAALDYFHEQLQAAASEPSIGPEAIEVSP